MLVLSSEGQRGRREFLGGVLCCVSNSDSQTDKLGTVTAVIPCVLTAVLKLCVFWWKVNTSRSTPPYCSNHLPYRSLFLRAGHQDCSGAGLAVTDTTVMVGWALGIIYVCIHLQHVMASGFKACNTVVLWVTFQTPNKLKKKKIHKFFFFLFPLLFFFIVNEQGWPSL